jgi:hypothetical protein
MNQHVNQTPPAFTVALGLILAGAAVWLALGALYAANLHPAVPGVAIIRWTLAILACLASCALIVLVMLLRGRHPMAYFSALGLLTLISPLTIMDEVGTADLIVIALHVIPLALLLKERRWYLRQAGT